MNLYQMIFKRRSIRKYKNDEVPVSLLNDILGFAGRVAALDDTIRVSFEIYDNRQGQCHPRGLWKITAPYYLVCCSEEKDGYAINAGYLLEPVLLYMAGRGLGTCCLGGTEILGTLPEGMKRVIAVAFGYSKTLLYRDPATAKRLPLKELCVFREEAGDTMLNLLKSIRLAPSAMNGQPWRFIVYKDRIYIFSCREFFSSSFTAAMRDLSIGIMLSHLSIASEEMWVNLRMETEESMGKKSYKSGTYVVTAFLTE